MEAVSGVVVELVEELVLVAFGKTSHYENVEQLA